jgi:hypothetical protein
VGIDAQALGPPSDRFDTVVGFFVFSLVPDPRVCLGGLKGVSRLVTARPSPELGTVPQALVQKRDT